MQPHTKRTNIAIHSDRIFRTRIRHACGPSSSPVPAAEKDGQGGRLLILEPSISQREMSGNLDFGKSFDHNVLGKPLKIYARLAWPVLTHSRAHQMNRLLILEPYHSQSEMSGNKRETRSRDTLKSIRSRAPHRTYWGMLVNEHAPDNLAGAATEPRTPVEPASYLRTLPLPERDVRE